MTDTGSIQKIYEEHHQAGSRGGFSILEEERGALFAETIGVGKKILDIGCRDGTLTRHFVKGNTVTGVDVDEVLMEKIRASLDIETLSIDLNGEWEQLNGKRFDVVVAGEILEHLYFPKRILTKIASILEPGGLLIGSVPNAFSLKNRARYALGRKEGTPLADPTHINHFSVPELRALLKERFKDVTIVGLGRYGRLARLSPQHFAFDLVFIARL